MKTLINNLKNNKTENYILPFLWMRGEEESIIREEMSKIYECGIRAVCVEARPHEEFCQAGWWHDMDIIIDEAEKRDMKVWILDDKHFPTGYANGLIKDKYPNRKKQYINYSIADVYGASKKSTLNVKNMLKPVMKFVDLGKPVDEEERKNNKLISVVAARLCEGSIVSEDVIDLTNTVDGDFAHFTLPAGAWRIFVTYLTRTDGGIVDYVNFLDKESAYTQIEGVYEAHYNQYKDKFGKVIAGFFSDEPQFGNTKIFEKNAIVGKMEMALPWSDELYSMLETIYGKDFVKYLPLLWNDSKEEKIGIKLRYDYMDSATKLYKENFSDTVGKWCEEHNVEYIGHVVEDNGAHSRLGLGAGHYFRALSGQHFSGIDVIGGQVCPGAPIQNREGFSTAGGEFFHYALGKLGASCGHLDPVKKGRTLCELFGAYGWKFGVRDMKYVLDHLLVKGVNYFVPHAFSMAEYPDKDCPPHFYARGNNPQFRYFAELMKYANRMAEIFNGGEHIASVAVLYDGEADWSGEHMQMQSVCRELTCNQIDFDIVCLDMLTDVERYGTKIGNGKIEINGESFGALIVPYTQRITKEFADFIQNNKGLDIIFIDNIPESIVNEYENETGYIKNFDSYKSVKLNVLAEKLKEAGYFDISLNTEFSNLSFYHYKKDGNIFMFVNESLEESFAGEITLPTNKKLVVYHGFDNVFENIESKVNGNKSVVELKLYPGQSIVILESDEMFIRKYNVNLNNNRVIDISNNWKVSKVRQIDYPNFEKAEVMEVLKPISDSDMSFAGVIRYEREFEVEAKDIKEAFIQIEEVFETMTVYLNGKKIKDCITPPYAVELGDNLVMGKNSIVVEVATTLERDQLNFPEHPFVFINDTIEPTGMFGEVNILFN